MNRDGHLDYKEFTDELAPKQRHARVGEDGAEDDSVAIGEVVPTLPKVLPDEAEAVREVMVGRVRQRQARAREEKLWREVAAAGLSPRSPAGLDDREGEKHAPV